MKGSRWHGLGTVLMAAAAFGSALMFDVDAAGQVQFLGAPWGSPCPFMDLTGVPCPYCGMTRSWIALVRGDVMGSLRYNPGGTALLTGIGILGFDGLFRLAGKGGRLSLVGVGYGVLFGFALFGVSWVLRVAVGFNPLPTPTL